MTKTLAQVVVIWGLVLWVVPVGITRVTRARGMTSLEFPPQPVAGWGLFLAASLVGLWTGLWMAREGEGTPLPLDHARRLVTTGPYAIVRNPMAVTGLSQGLGVALVLGSWAVLAYVLAGAAFWNWALRPLEERQLAADFGGAYETYRRAVRCWLPGKPAVRLPSSQRDP